MGQKHGYIELVTLEDEIIIGDFGLIHVGKSEVWT